jgi:hypothetical protein
MKAPAPLRDVPSVRHIPRGNQALPYYTTRQIVEHERPLRISGSEPHLEDLLKSAS